MAKTNKELAIDVALKVIESHQRIPYGINNREVLKSIDLESICNIIKGVHATLEKIDKDSPAE